MNELNVYKRKDGRFEGRKYLGRDESGKRKYKSYYGATKSEVIEKYRCSIISYADYSTTAMKISELVEEWLNVISNRIKESTAANYRMKAKKHILPAFGDKNCCELYSKEIYVFVENKLKSGLSIRYVSDILVLLKSIFSYANREYNIKNVIDGIVMPKKSKPDVRLLTEQEQNILKKYIKETPNLTNTGVMMSLYTGLRIGELCALRWQDIDLEKRVLTVRQTIQRIQTDGTKRTKIIISEPKSESSRRDIPIPDCLLPILARFKDKEDVFILSGKNKPIEPRTMQYRFAKLLNRIGLPSVHFHSLRHNFASNAVALGFDIKTLSELLGHSSIELTLNRYVHSSMELKRACMKLFSWSV